MSSQPPYAKIECPHCKSSIRVRTALGQYHIQRLLGEGGMSQVFLARDETLGRSVALKVLHKELSRDEKLTASFEREAKTTASINHPNVVKVYTVGSDFGYFFIAMELVDNVSLEEMITNDDRVPQLKVLQIAHDVTSGLYAAYKAGLIHRDIKPGNILLTSDGRAKLVDFGLAVQTGHFDADEDVWATPFYVPPEKLEGEPDDFRGDIYSLGATLFHAISGTPPYAANTASLEELKKIKAKTIRLIETVPDARKRTCKLIDRMMARKPSDRHQNYKELLTEIIEVENKLGSRRRPATAITAIHGEETPKNSWVKPAVAAGVAVLLIAGASLAFMGSQEEELNDSLLSGGNERVLVAGEQNTAASYVEARAMLGEGQVAKAQALLQMISKSSDLKEPTRTWTQFNLGVCKLLRGNEKEARGIFLRLTPKSETEKAGLETAGLDEFFQQSGKALNDVLPVRNDEFTSLGKGTGQQGLVYLAFGLKNWNQGQFKSAVRFFKQFQVAEFPEPSSWVEGLKKQISVYLQDGKVLKDLPNPRLSMDDAQLAKVRVQLKQAKEQLKTQGAAPQLLEDRIARIQVLQKEQKRLASLPKVTPRPVMAAAAVGDETVGPPADKGVAMPGGSPSAGGTGEKPPVLDSSLDAESMKDLKKILAVEQVAQGLGANFEFPQASSRFQMVDAGTDLGRQLLAGEMDIVKRAESFLTLLIGKLNEGIYEGDVLRKEKPPLQAKITAATRTALVVDLGFGGNEVALEEFSSSWLLTVARELLEEEVKSNPENYANAVCFAWATGEQELAHKLAKKGKDYPEGFKEMWKNKMKNLPR